MLENHVLRVHEAASAACGEGKICRDSQAGSHTLDPIRELILSRLFFISSSEDNDHVNP